MGSPAEHRALEYAVAKFKEYGCDTAYIMPMLTSSRAITTSGIAVGIKRGKTGRMICLGGHIDSAGPEIPGADDDGSGASTVIELAHVLAKTQHHSSIVFCCFGGEEQGLEGSYYFADHFSMLDSIDLMLQIDMANGLGIIDMDPDTHGASAPPWLIRAAAQEFYNLGYRNLRYPTHFFAINYAGKAGSGSDQEPFLRKGIPAIDFSTDVYSPIHTPRDNFQNFDPRGLKRSGDLIVRLFERFDGGVPSRTTEEHWLLLRGPTAIIFPIWSLWAFSAVSILIGFLLFISLRKNRLPNNDPTRHSVPTLKHFLLSFIFVSFAWFSWDVIGVIKGYRHPWFTDIPLYYVLAFAASLIGLAVCFRLARKLKITHCVYALFRPTFIALVLLTIGLGLMNIKLAIYPALGLLFASLALVIKKQSLRLVLVCLAPLPLLRLFFSEWYDIVLRSFGSGLAADNFATICATNLVFALFFTIFLFPFATAFTAVLRDSPGLVHFLTWIRSRGFAIAAILLTVFISIAAINRPVYNNFWYRDVHIAEVYDMNKSTKNVHLTSPEYLTSVKVHTEAGDTLLPKATEVSIPIRSKFDTTWLKIDRAQTVTQNGDTTSYDIKLMLNCAFRPYTVNVRYSRGMKSIRRFATPLFAKEIDSARVMDWYSFPDTNIIVPVKFQVIGKDSVTESISVVFDSLAYPLHCERDMTYFLPRTTYMSSYEYKK